ncbi:MCAT [Cordylochernes scorpioides]|uniref:MCAT n=1 Tax=Cordylochernes scorpioides TaxID=51811 RepID=A0ABY6KB19_9ARAC|nr:MCAT [Cordylochernes scorpioides]
MVQAMIIMSYILGMWQGSQFVGMGKHLLEIPRVEEMFRVAKTILGYDLMDKCLHGPSKELNSTEICQPAVFVTSLAAVEKLREINPNAINHCVATAGFSVGEITALVFAGVLKFEDGR